MPSAVILMNVPENEQTLAEEASACFAGGEDDQAIALLMNHLKEYGKTSSSHRPWHLLMDIYQARGDRASFEKLAALFANRFEISPPSWRPIRLSPAPATVMGRNVLVVMGPPSSVGADKRRDFLAASREQGFCRLDLSRLELPRDPGAFETEVGILLSLFDRMTRLRLKVMLMGDGQLMQGLREGVESARWEEGPLRAAWTLLLALLQWRGLKAEFDQRAMTFADRFDRFPPGYEDDAVLALDEPAHQDDAHPNQWTEADVRQHCEELRQDGATRGSARLDLSKVFRMDYPSAMVLSGFLAKEGMDARRVELDHASEMLIALFDATGVSPQVTYTNRGR